MFKKIVRNYKKTFYPVKGNINKKGEKIYHIPNGRFYETVQPVDYFRSEKSAEEAGYRKSRN
ncbi:hypothetical protein IMZ31_20410 (plasmid) [Pontibacillus sp. ALD_SL1]|uniref:sunset domain-containing protein n=1 Tax=Pontibacillus sp. ALD_SL1 TaxID=2777185 RepID=UPI001A95D167|nr:hypothetical protein [Pontibacillus sp. ALD_SL1]QST02914.1 hypothetical protein IMZ31_20410 [Pontibacillus sp. ALD_SL1]